MGGGARPTVKLLFSSSDDGTVKVWDLIVSFCIFQLASCRRRR